MRVSRICNRKYAVAAFSGEGAYLYCGRWNPAGVRMVYTSTSLALAAVEFFVHLEPSTASATLVSMSATLPDDLQVDQIAIENLPANWRMVDRVDLQQLGADWIASGKSVALRVPSVVISGEWNVLLNPTHPDFKRIIIEAPEPFVCDSRMFK
jgi:RES domain-containing protein